MDHHGDKGCTGRLLVIHGADAEEPRGSSDHGLAGKPTFGRTAKNLQELCLCLAGRVEQLGSREHHHVTSPAGCRATGERYRRVMRVTEIDQGPTLGGVDRLLSTSRTLRKLDSWHGRRSRCFPDHRQVAAFPGGAPCERGSVDGGFCRSTLGSARGTDSSMVPVVDLSVERHYRVELERPILENVRWRIEPGEHWALVGANGSGKSTLLSIVSGDLWPSTGVVRVLGAEYGTIDKREHKKRIGVVSAAMFTTLPSLDTATQVAASGIRAMIGRLGPETPEELARARHALSRVRADECGDKPYGVLSQGEKQRVMIARALINEPSLLVLDEPCAGLDPVARERFLSDLTHLSREPSGPTQIHVTHHLEEIPELVTHALVLRKGRVLASGRAPDVLTSECLGEAFGAPLVVEVETTGSGSRYRLRITDRGG